MCGIVGVVGNTNATDILIQGLEKLEYRGYDSAGIFVASDASSQLVKAVGRIAELAAKTEGVEGTAGIGHTRWATHGKPTEDNATHTAQKLNVLFWFTMVLLKTILKLRKNTFLVTISKVKLILKLQFT